MSPKKITHVLTRDEHDLVMQALARLCDYDAAMIVHIKEHAKKDKSLRKTAPRAVERFEERQGRTSKLQVKMLKTLFGDK